MKERVAHLATLRNAAPMASMTLYLPEKDFSAFYVHVSRLAWHTQDMAQDARVALSIAETDDRRADPFTLMRVTVRGDALQIQDKSDELKAPLARALPGSRRSISSSPISRSGKLRRATRASSPALAASTTSPLRISKLHEC